MPATDLSVLTQLGFDKLSDRCYDRLYNVNRTNFWSYLRIPLSTDRALVTEIIRAIEAWLVLRYADEQYLTHPTDSFRRENIEMLSLRDALIAEIRSLDEVRAVRLPRREKMRLTASIVSDCLRSAFATIGAVYRMDHQPFDNIISASFTTQVEERYSIVTVLYLTYSMKDALGNIRHYIRSAPIMKFNGIETFQQVAADKN